MLGRFLVSEPTFKCAGICAMPKAELNKKSCVITLSIIQATSDNSKKWSTMSPIEVKYLAIFGCAQ